MLKIVAFLRNFVNTYSEKPAKQRDALLRNAYETRQTPWKRAREAYKRYRKKFSDAKNYSFLFIAVNAASCSATNIRR